MQHEDNCPGFVLDLYEDLRTFFPDQGVEIARDLRTARREAARGLSFFSSTLPKLHNECLARLESGASPPECLHLKWLVARIWDSPGSTSAGFALACHRQLCHALYKVEVPYSDDTLRSTFDRYVSTELANSDTRQRLQSVRSIATRRLLGTAAFRLRSAIPAAYSAPRSAGSTPVLRDVLGMLPRHGPGCVATGERGDSKWDFSRLYASAHSRFPWYDWFVSRGVDALAYRHNWYESLERVAYPTSRVVAVPKDSRGPRLISEEPLEIQFLQQGYLRLMTSWVLNGPMKGHVFFDDQTVHRNLALQSSKSQVYATIDLKDASDRVTRTLVQLLFPKEVFLDLDALRSRSTVLPDGRTIDLEKMSPMGSSVCFPTMAFALWSIVSVVLDDAVECGLLSASKRDDVFIFGDDLIVPVEVVEWVRSSLTSVGLLVNVDKSYSRSFFRESCGMDAYYGVDVTPTRIRHLLDSRVVLGSETSLAYYSYVNSLRRKGWCRTADSMQSALEQACRAKAPLTWSTEDYPGILVDRSQPLNVPTRWSRKYSSLMARVPVPCGIERNVKIDGDRRLLRNLVMGSGDSPGTTTDRGRVRVQQRWRRIAHTASE